MTIREQKYSLAELLYFTSYGVFLIISILAFSFFAKQVNGIPHVLVVVVCVGLLVLKELTTGYYNRRELWSLVLCVALFLIVLRVGRDVEELCIAFQIFYIFCARDISFDRIARFTILVTGTLCVVIVGCSLLGIVRNVVLIQEETNRVRECLGFRYALYLPTLFMNVVALWVCERRERISVPGAAVLLLINQWIYERTMSRAAYGITIALLAVALLLKYVPGLVKHLRPLFFLMVFSYPAAAGSSLWLTAHYDKSIPWMGRLDESLSARLQFGKESMKTYGFSLFGEDITWVGNGLDMDGYPMAGKYNFVDCLYLQMLQHFGFFFFVAYLAVMVLLLYRCYQRQAFCLMTVLTAVAFHCMLDDLAQYLPFHSFWLAVGPMLLGEEGKGLMEQIAVRRPRYRLQW